MAFNLAKLHLPSEHYLRRSVCASYSVWLAKSRRNPNLLATLQTELGMSTQNCEKTDCEQQTASEQGPAETVADFSDLLRKLNKQHAKNNSAKKKPAKVVSVGQPWQDSLTDAEIESRATRKSNLQSTQSLSDAELPSDGGSPVDCASSSQPAGLNLHSTRDVAMRKSSRSFFRDGGGVEVNGAASSVVTEKESTEPDVERFNYDELKRKLVALVPSTTIIFVTVLIFKAVCGADNFSLPAFYSSLSGKRFATADGALSIRAGADGLTVSGRSLHRTVAPLVWRGSLSDEMSLLCGAYRNCVWLTPAENGLQDQNGRRFFAESAPELRTMSAMDKIADQAQRFFSATGHYPGANDLRTYQYRNAFNSGIESVSVCSMVMGESALDRLNSCLQQGQLFEHEVSREPGQIAAFCINAIGHDQSEPECQSLYLHAFDGHGRLIKTADADKTFVTALRHGRTVRTDAAASVKRYSQATFCLAPHQPEVASVFCKYGIAVLVLGTFVFVTLWNQKRVSED